MANIPVLVFANKQDLPEAATVTEVAHHFTLNELHNPWHIQACCALTGDGLVKGFQRMADLIKNTK